MRAWLESVQSAWYGGARWWVVLLPLSWIVRAVAAYRRVTISLPACHTRDPRCGSRRHYGDGAGKTQVLVALAVVEVGVCVWRW